MAICIAGMHRSGTSMITRLLNVCGLYLGPDRELLPPTSHNEEGYWENARFMEMNDAILKQLGGAWDCPPPLEPGWELAPALEPLYAQAESLLSRLNGRDPWGWKDPRNCLTASFWKRLRPDLPFVICVRNPLEVISSLLKRNEFSAVLTQSLWVAHYRNLLAVVPPDKRVVTHYDAYFPDPSAELRRVLTALGLPVREEEIRSACAAASNRLRHHRSTTRDLLMADIRAVTVKFYLQLCDEACLHDGPVFSAPETETVSPQDDPNWARGVDPSILAAYAAELERRVGRDAERLAEQQRRLETALNEAAEKEPAFRELRAELAREHGAREQLARRVVQTEQLQTALSEQLAASQKTIAELHTHISTIVASRSWRLIHRVKRIRSKLLPFRKAG